ncbi:UGMP family protein [Candidatus Woesearchaeota archaeon]|nr:UGMP family protein [Candidatus Woesearchaeota archaeon]
MKFNVLGIESTAHTFSVGIFDGEKILANERDTFTTVEGGMIPNKVAEHHVEIKNEILKRALEKAKIKIEDVDLIAYSEGPGLAPCLKVGRDFAVELGEKYKKKILGVNHIVAHFMHEDKYRIFGESLSIAVGNAFDKFAREIGLGFPGGPKVEEMAKNGKYVKLPYSVKGMDVDFSGIVSRAIQLYHQGYSKEDLCYSLQETCFAMLIEVAERALAHCEKNEVLLIGGVAASKRFSKMLSDMCIARDVKAYTVPLEYAGDQGAMIAYQGFLERERVQKEFDFNPRWRIDDIETFWKK